MKTQRLLAILGLLFAAGLTGPWAQRVEACAPAPPRNVPVAIADESAIIIWDEGSQTQHFIRRASFTTQAPDFGFLVPTPSQPELGEASDESFKVLAKITEPKIVTQPRPSSGGCSIGCGKASLDKGVSKVATPVEVLDQKRIAGQDIVVLKATDADELAKWLTDHGYDFSSALKDWIKPYIDAKWIITASKIAKGKDVSESDRVASTAVRMTFKTDKPFFPYSEPADQRDKNQSSPPRLLRVFYLSTGKVKGAVGQTSASWNGTVVWANKIASNDREKLLDLLRLPKDTPPAAWWLTEFEDRSSPRPGSYDVYFGPADDQNPVERPAHIRYVAADLRDGFMTYALAVCMVVPCVVRRRRRRR